MILLSLKLDEQLLMNKYAKVAVQSTTTEQAQQQQRIRGPTISPLTARANLSLNKPSTILGSKSIKRRKTRRTVAVSERDRLAQKSKREKGTEKNSEFFGTTNNDSDSATTNKTKTKTKKL